MTKTTESNKKESKIWNNKFYILLGTYLIAFIGLGEASPVLIGIALIEFTNLDISPIGLTLGIISIIGTFIIQINYRKKGLKWMIFQLAVVCIMYLSWLFFVIEGINKIQSDISFWEGLILYLVFSLFYQITTYVIFNKLKKQFNLIRVARHN